MNFDNKNIGRPSTKDKSLKKFLNSPAIMASAFSTKFSPENPNELCDRIKLLLQEKQAGNNSNLIIEEITAIVEKLSDYRCISKKQHKQILFKCNLLITKEK